MRDIEVSSLRLQRVAVRDGFWEGRLTRVGPGEGTPVVEICHRDRPAGTADITEMSENVWSVRVPIPANTLSDGLQTYALVDQATGLALDSFTLSLGEALGEDLRAEVDLLRAELDLLKRAFRRHCAES